MPRRNGPKLNVAAVSCRPTVVGRHYAVATGHYLASLAALRVLDRGGNAVDAGVTAAMALAVLQPDIVSFAGVAPTLIYLRKEQRVISLAGLGWWPQSTDLDVLRQAGDGKHVPEGLLRTVMPAAPATNIEALARYGTISFEEAATPALELAAGGFAVFPFLANNISSMAESYARWPSSAAVFLPHGRAPQRGELFVQRELAQSIANMIDAERKCAGSRGAKLAAARDYFYRGPIADAIADYHRENGGFVTREDLAGFNVAVEDSISIRYRDYEVHACDVWCQGVTLLQTLKLLEGCDLRALGHNSADYLHTVAEALNLSFADREAYVGDPKFVRVPTVALLSDGYAARQRARIRRERAFGTMPAPGDPEARVRAGDARAVYAAAHGAARMAPDTIYASVIDRDGNAYSATLSDTSYDTPVIPGYGGVISSRGMQSRLAPGHPSIAAPGKRPRLTPMPALALKDGEAFMAWGTPGGDVQPQAMLQVFLNVTEFGMPVQQAIEAPRVCSYSFPNSFAPHDYLPGRLAVEGAVGAATVDALKARGHDVEVWPLFPASSGAVCAVVRDPATGLKHAGADPRREAYALAW